MDDRDIDRDRLPREKWLRQILIPRRLAKPSLAIMGRMGFQLVASPIAVACCLAVALERARAEPHFSCEIAPPAELKSAVLRSIPALGKKKVLYYRVAYRLPNGEPKAPASEGVADSDMKQVNEYYTRVSRGLFSLEWQITPLLILPNEQIYYEKSGGLEGVLRDAREAALAAGFNYQHFDFDLVHVATLVGTDAGGRGKIGERGAWMSTGGPYIIAHELGHNLGWNHANLWSTGSPNTFSLATHPSITRGEELNAYPRDPDGLIGHESIYGPGEEREYGDPFDVMGGGNEGAVNAIFQYGVGWLPDASLTTATTNGTYRLHAFDRGEIADGRTYLLRLGDILLQGRARRTYWIQYRYNLGNMPPGNGVLLYWNDADRTHGPTLLLDAEPGEMHRQQDPTLKTGRTFFDPLLNFYITPVRQGLTDGAPWIDVEINRSPADTNRAPTLELAAPSALAVGELATIQAHAIDPDGDELSFFWDFGDGTCDAAPDSTSKAYSASGEYIVRVEVSDRKGGKTSGHVVIRVGTPITWRISGQVRDRSGNPVPDVRVHNGIYSRNPGSANYRFMFTDSHGRYTLTGLSAGSYSNSAFHLRYECVLADAEEVITITNASVANVDFIADPLPVIALHLQDRNLYEEDSTALVITRTNRIDEPLTVHLAVGGTAGGNEIIFQGPWLVPVTFNDVSTYEIRFPAGESSAALDVTVLFDIHRELEETLTFALQWPTGLQTGPFGANVLPVPGWQLKERYGTTMWSQSQPSYVLEEAFATMVIRDSTNVRPILTISGTDASENPHAPGEFVIGVQGEREGDLRVAYAVTGSAMNGVDYEKISGELIIPRAHSSGKIPIIPISDQILDRNETVELKLLPDPGYRVHTGTAQIRITDRTILPLPLSIEIDTNGSVIVSAQVRAGQTHILEATTNLLSRWTTIRALNAFVDHPARFRIDRADMSGVQIFRSGTTWDTIEYLPGRTNVVEFPPGRTDVVQFPLARGQAP